VFLFRNYKPDLGKWQTSDPLGYPDGFDNFAYCGNMPSSCIDTDGRFWNLVAGTLIGATIGYVASAANGGSDVNNLAGALGGAVGGAIAGAGQGTLGMVVGSAVTAGITTFANADALAE
jgi:hypothetical protein